MKSLFLKVKDVAIELNMKEDKIRDLLKKRKLKGHKFDGEWRIHRISLDNYIKKCSSF